MTNVLTTEQLAQAEQKLTAPKITIEQIEANVAKEEYHRFPGTTITVCLLTMKNGFTAMGKSAAASVANFNEEVGRTYARKNAIDKLWEPMGYELRSKLALIEQAGAPTGFIATHEEVKTYLGTKVVHAAPLSRGDYNKLRGWEVPADEDPEDEGYLVEYVDGGAKNHPAFSGYISWSPRDVFEKAYNVGVVLKETTFVERMVKELEELTERTNKLATFIGSEKFKGLPAMDQHDLKEQHTAMENYAWHLTARMKRASGLR